MKTLDKDYLEYLLNTRNYFYNISDTNKYDKVQKDIDKLLNNK